jgi:ribonuclease HII
MHPGLISALHPPGFYEWLFGVNALQSHDLRRLAECDFLVGVDEAGRGALAGPVVAGACVLARPFFTREDVLARTEEINDSTQLSAAGRAAQLKSIEALRAQGCLDFAVALASVEEIAAFNILGATRLAMLRALQALAARADGWELCPVEIGGPLFDTEPAPVRCLVDGRPLRPFPYMHEGLVQGDQRSLSIAMASIAAKVERDRLMCRLAEDFPAYGFEVHKGYGTQAHREALLRHGPSPAHRDLFLRKILGKSRI